MSYQPNQPGYPPDQPDYQPQQPHQPGPAARAAASTSPLLIRLVYVAMGLILGGVWLASSGQSLLSHVWHDLLVLVVLLVVVHTRLRKRQGRPGASALPQVSYGWIISAKVALLIIAAGVEWLLQRAGVAHPDLIVAAGLFVIVALAGPAAHHLFLRPPKRA